MKVNIIKGSVLNELFRHKYPTDPIEGPAAFYIGQRVVEIKNGIMYRSHKFMNDTEGYYIKYIGEYDL